MIIPLFRRIRRWLFNYPQKIEVSIHHSLTNNIALLAVRVIALLVLSYRYVYSILIYDSAFIITEYLTEFGFLLTWTYFALACEDYLLNETRKEKICKQLPNWISILFEIAICMETIVTILFWSVLYDYSKSFFLTDFLMEVGVHGFPFICLLLDLSLNTYQFPKRHLAVAILVGILYMVENIAYSLSVKPVYKPLDWVSFMSYVYVVASLALVVVVHISIRKYWQRYRRPKLVDLLKVDTQHYINFDSNTINK